MQLFRTLKDRKPGDPDWDDLVAFLQEFCSLAKHLQLPQRQNCWAKMTQLGMFEVREFLCAKGCSPVLGYARDVPCYQNGYIQLVLFGSTREALLRAAGHMLPCIDACIQVPKHQAHCSTRHGHILYRQYPHTHVLLSGF